jgi:hypothetical protein
LEMHLYWVNDKICEADDELKEFFTKILC